MRVVADNHNRRVMLVLRDQQNATRRGIRQGFFRLGKDLVKDARQLIIKGPKTGRLYRLPGRKKRHRASAPGEPPANRTGALQRSIDFQIHGADSMEFGSNPNANLLARAAAPAGASISVYPAALEFGTGRMAPRPYLRPTIEKNNRRARAHFEAEIRRALQ